MSSTPLKLGIACVYFYGTEGIWLLDLQLKYIANTLAGYDYTVYAGANRLQPELRKTLECAPHVKIVQLPVYDGAGGPEHAFYLDLLLWRAASDGCTHIAALDCDSFPILPDWPQHLLREMGPSIRLAAVFRTENQDTFLPHPSGYFMWRSFLLERRPTLLPTESDLATVHYQEFLDATRQRADTGIGYAYSLWRHAEEWLPLRRSNLRNPHFLMAGIYGGVFFHLGASSRQPAFHVDYMTKPSLRLSIRLRNLPFVWRIADKLEDRYLARNENTYRQISNLLRKDPALFLKQLATRHSLGTPNV